MWPRSDKRHCPHQNTDKLRQLIERSLTQKLSNLSNSWVVMNLWQYPFSGICTRIDQILIEFIRFCSPISNAKMRIHRAKLQKSKKLTSFSDSLTFIDNRSLTLKLNRYCNQKQNRRKHNQCKNRSNNIKNPLKNEGSPI